MNSYEQTAYERGRRAAEAAATWTEPPKPPHTVTSIIEWIECEHPSVDNHLPSRPDLSAEWGGSETPRTLVRAVWGSSTPNVCPESLQDQICEAWEQGVNDHFYKACATELRRQTIKVSA